MSLADMARMATRTRRRRDSSGHLNPASQRIRRYEAVLRPLGLWEGFNAMPRRAQELFCLKKFPDPVLEFDASYPADRGHWTLRKSLEKAFREAFIVIDDAEVTVRDFFAVVGGLKAVFAGAVEAPSWPESCRKYMHQAGPLLDYWFTHHFNETFASLHAAVIVPLVAHSRLDARLLRAQVACDNTAQGKFVIRMTVSASPPEMRRVSLDGGMRPMFRVGTTNEWHGVRWASWNPSKLGRTAPPQEYPVYAQSHALRQLHQRVNLPRMAAYLEYWLYHSLAEPLIVERQGENLLVEYRIREHRIGYLVVTPLADVVAVRTFLFLTMERTPEARLLHKQLRLQRSDVEWLGLCNLEAFTQTDLKADAVVRPLMEACGCGHLFNLGDAEYAPHPKALAAEVRRYLRKAA